MKPKEGYDFPVGFSKKGNKLGRPTGRTNKHKVMFYTSLKWKNFIDDRAYQEGISVAHFMRVLVEVYGGKPIPPQR